MPTGGLKDFISDAVGKVTRSLGLSDGDAKLVSGDKVSGIDKSPAATDLCDFLVNEFLKPALDAQKVVELFCKRSMLQLRGLQYVTLNPDDHRLDISPKAPVDWIAVLVGLAVYLERCAKLGAVAKGFNVYPGNATEPDVTGARAIDRLSNSIVFAELKRIEVPMHFNMEWFGPVLIQPVVYETGYTLTLPEMLSENTPFPVPANYLSIDPERGPYPSKVENQLKIDGQPQYFKTADGNPDVRRRTRHQLRMILRKPMSHLIDQAIEGITEMNRARFLGFTSSLTRSEVKDICGDPDEEGKENKLTWEKTTDQNPADAEFLRLSNLGNPGDGSEPVVSSIETFFAPRSWADPKWRKKMPTELRDGAHIIFDANAHAIIHLGKLPDSYKGDLSTIGGWAQSWPIAMSSGCGPLTPQTATFSAQAAISQCESDMNRSRQINTKTKIMGTDISSASMHTIGPDLDAIDVGSGRIQPMQLDPVPIEMTHLRGQQNLVAHIERLTSTSLLPSARQMSATEVQQRAFQSGQLIDLTGQSIMAAWIQVCKTSIELIRTSFSEGEILRVLGDFGDWEQWALKRAELQGDHDINVKVGAWRHGDPVAHLQMIQMLGQSNGQSPVNTEMLAKLANLEELFDQSPEAKARAQVYRILRKLATRKDYKPAVYSYDSLEVFIKFTTDFCREYRDQLEENPAAHAKISAFMQMLNDSLAAQREAAYQEQLRQQALLQGASRPPIDLGKRQAEIERTRAQADESRAGAVEKRARAVAALTPEEPATPSAEGTGETPEGEQR